MAADFEALLQEIGLSLRPEPVDDVTFIVKSVDGTLVRATEGTAIVKSLSVRVRNNERKIRRVMRQVMDIAKSNSEKIAELTGGAPKRRSPAPDTVSPDSFFAKALQAQAEGRISAHDISRAEAFIGAGQPIPVDLVRRVLAETSG